MCTIPKQHTLDYHKLKILFAKHRANRLEGEEQEAFYKALEDIDEITFESLMADSNAVDPIPNFDKDDVFLRIEDTIDALDVHKEQKSAVSIRNLFNSSLAKVAAAVVVLFLFAYFMLQYNSMKDGKALDDQSAYVSDADSLRLDGANIQFADGKSINLEDIKDDTLIYKGMSIIRTDNNELVINNEVNAGSFDENHFHKFVAKAGTTLKLILPDKSNVHLNSGSSINISAGFGLINRNVLLKGEGFFEVAHNKEVPFIVAVKHAKINVLGTVFNISGYDQDTQVKATLLSGSIKVLTPSTQSVIKPGQQAQVDKDDNIAVAQHVDLSRTLAWREGVFRFNDESIAEILNELSKWYFIKEVTIAAGVKDKFTGSIKRTQRLEDVLDAISEVSNLKFLVEEGRIAVMK